MQAALMLRSKSRERRKQRLKRGFKHELPSNVATKQIAPFPRYPPASWCAAGRAAWQEAAALSVGGGGAGAGGAARRCSVLGDHPRARHDKHRVPWHRTNRVSTVRDASYGSSSSSSEAGEGGGAARLLYAGLATLAVGLVVYFVGTGDKGFKTPALRLVGPSLIVAGLACCLLRILLCVVARPCCRRRQLYKESRRLSGGDGEEMPLAGAGAAVAAGARAGPAQCSPARRLDASSCDVSSLSSGEEDERLRRYRTAPPAPAPPPPPPPAPPPAPARRPPPRNVSFAGPDGELVLSPAQLRS
ncbi:uncharacterized protein LOC105398536 isoform X1 [Plutella xylostella]|uniref:uncharacterized protein LOC105398536 isoform X1 n=1 Tax=Plutella xylostella TaxID=51655 RepID=UPI0018D1AF16|nr:uncharacterized protein LOC105398536 isoform X1 [Plutella xylostella]XP_048482963.1 uncharacterized protein LOC105398536 isoform X1 [Plutella xylostella]